VCGKQRSNRLSLQDAVNMALRYNLGAIESGEMSKSHRGQRLIALSIFYRR